MVDLDAETPEQVDPSEWPDEWRQAIRTLYHASRGDEVIWGNRVTPLTVTDSEIGGDDDRARITAEGPRGGTYSIREQYNPTGGLLLTTDNANQNANDLRFAGDDAGANEAPEPEDDDDGPDLDLAIDIETGEILDDDDGEEVETSRAPPDDEGAPDEEDHPSGQFDVDDTRDPWPQDDPVRDEGEPTEMTADEFASTIVDDPWIEGFDELADAVGMDVPAEDRRNMIDAVFRRQQTQGETNAWTFVDELNAFGQPIPAVVSGWELFDPGLVRAESTTRRATWKHTETQESLILQAENRGGEVVWEVYLLEQTPDDFSPELTTEDPHEALTVLYELLGVPESPDFEVVRQPDGTLLFRDNIEDEDLGRRVSTLEPFGGALAARAPAVTGGRASSALLGGADRVVGWLEENAVRVGQLTKFAFVYTVLGLSKRALGVGVRPVITRKRMGVEFQYTYEGSQAEWLNQEFAGEMTIDPGKFSWDGGENGVHLLSLGNIGMDYDDAVRAAELLSLEEYEVRLSDVFDEHQSDRDERSTTRRSSSSRRGSTTASAAQRRIGRQVQQSSDSSGGTSTTFPDWVIQMRSWGRDNYDNWETLKDRVEESEKGKGQSRSIIGEFRAAWADEMDLADDHPVHGPAEESLDVIHEAIEDEISDVSGEDDSDTLDQEVPAEDEVIESYAEDIENALGFNDLVDSYLDGPEVFAGAIQIERDEIAVSLNEDPTANIYSEASLDALAEELEKEVWLRGLPDHEKEEREPVWLASPPEDQTENTVRSVSVDNEDVPFDEEDREEVENMKRSAARDAGQALGSPDANDVGAMYGGRVTSEESAGESIDLGMVEDMGMLETFEERGGDPAADDRL